MTGDENQPTQSATAGVEVPEAYTVLQETKRVSRRVGNVLFGDRTGLVVFLGALLWCSALWRVGIFITDTVTVANALANVAEGRLALVETPYSLTIGAQPGAVTVGGETFGRSYGQVFLALPILWVLEGLTALADPSLLLAGGWSLLGVAFAGQLHRVTGREWVRTAGSGVALLVFVVNVALATPLPREMLAFVALQVSTLLVAAFLATTMYRLLAWFQSRRVGVVAGIGVVLATPVGFWAPIPKRHVVTAGAVMAVLYCFAVSRTRTDRRGVAARAMGYALVGLLTTVHPFEAFFLLLVLAPIDLVTAPSNRGRTLALVALVFLSSLVPLFAINTAVTGNPVQPPRLVDGYGGEFDFQTGQSGGDGAGGGGDRGDGPTGEETDDGDGSQTDVSTGSGDDGETTDVSTGSGDDGETTDVSTGGGDGATPQRDGGTGSTATPTTPDEGRTDGGGAGPLGTIGPFLASLVGFAGTWLSESISALTQSDRAYRTFLRSGQLSRTYTAATYEAIDLSLLESLPTAAALVSLPVAAVRRFQPRLVRPSRWSVQRQTDLLAVGFAVVFTLVYMPRLPLHLQITLRYLLPVMVLLTYGVVRLPVVHEAIQRELRWAIGAYLVTVIAGGTVVVAALTVADPAIGEAMQFHGLVGLAGAAVTAVAVLSWPVVEDIRIPAVGLAVSAGVTTVLVVLASVEYFGRQIPNATPGTELYALDVVRVVAELLPVFAG